MWSTMHNEKKQNVKTKLKNLITEMHIWYKLFIVSYFLETTTIEINNRHYNNNFIFCFSIYRNYWLRSLCLHFPLHLEKTIREIKNGILKIPFRMNFLLNSVFALNLQIWLIPKKTKTCTSL